MQAKVALEVMAQLVAKLVLRVLRVLRVLQVVLFYLLVKALWLLAVRLAPIMVRKQLALVRWRSVLRAQLWQVHKLLGKTALRWVRVRWHRV